MAQHSQYNDINIPLLYLNWGRKEELIEIRPQGDYGCKELELLPRLQTTTFVSRVPSAFHFVCERIYVRGGMFSSGFINTGLIVSVSLKGEGF